MIFDKFYNNFPIRKVKISCGGQEDKIGIQLNIFDSFENMKNIEYLNKSIDNIKDRFGKNAILKATSLLADSTIIERNKKIGGHNA